MHDTVHQHGHMCCIIIHVHALTKGMDIVCCEQYCDGYVTSALHHSSHSNLTIILVVPKHWFLKANRHNCGDQSPCERK